MRKYEGGGVIAPIYQDLVDICENSVSVDESQEYQGQNEEVCVVSPKNSTTIYLTATSSSGPMSGDNNDDKLVLRRAKIENDEPYSQPDTATSSYLSCTPRTAQHLHFILVLHYVLL